MGEKNNLMFYDFNVFKVLEITRFTLYLFVFISITYLDIFIIENYTISFIFYYCAFTL